MGPDSPSLPSLLDETKQPVENLPAFCLAHYRSLFYSALARGEARHFVFPYSFLGSTIIPVLYLCIPHRKRPWLYQARWAVLALVVALNVDLLRNGSSSANVVASYLCGLVAFWGVVWGFTVLVVLEPQFEVARVQMRRKGLQEAGDGAVGNGNGDTKERVVDQQEMVPIDESVTMIQDKYEHYWQYYPEDGTFFERLGWVLELIHSQRGVGWNIAIPSVPHPPPPPPNPTYPRQLQLVNLSATPITSRTGNHRSLTYRSFIINRLLHSITTWLILDLCTIFARRDPYFTLGPSYPPSYLPPLLSSLPPHLLSLYRSLTSLIAVLSGLIFYINISQLLSCVLLGRYLHLTTPSLWQYPSPFGSFTSSILDNGLAGFWGGWWHQTLRLGFTAPTTYLTKLGYLPRNSPTQRMISLLSAFTLSALLHASAASTTPSPSTSPFYPIAFFLLSPLGILLQSLFTTTILPKLNLPLLPHPTPKLLRRAGNFVFVAGWLHATRWLFIDDMARAGLFLFEAIPVSPFRLLGAWGVFGERWVEGMGLLRGDEGWWRWDGECFPRWVWGREGRWWEGGVRL